MTNKPHKLIATHVDADLGQLELWGWHRSRGLLDFATSRVDEYEWRGQLGTLALVLPVDTNCDPGKQLGLLRPTVRATLKALSAREPEIRRAVAQNQLMVAREWLNDPALSEDVLYRALRCTGIDVYADAHDASIDLFFEHVTETLGGHVFIASLDQAGKVADIGLHG